MDELQAHQIRITSKVEELLQTFVTLEEAHDLLLGLYESSPAGYVTLNQELMVCKINLTGAAVLGGPREQILGSDFLQYVTADDRVRFERNTRKASRTPKRISFDFVLQRGDGSVFEAHCDCIRMVVNERPAIGLVLVDIGERKRAETEIRQLAFHDPLTALPNRRLLLDRLQHVLAHSATGLRYGAIFYLDLDDFKTLNDTQGHAVGDLLLQQVARRLIDCTPVLDTVARLGGDEFVVVAQNLGKNVEAAAKAAKKLGEKLLDCLEQSYLLSGRPYQTSGSIGVTLFRDTSLSIETLLQQADLALYAAKSVRPGKMRFFDPEMQRTVAARGVLDADIRRALQDKSFILHYQPQVDHRGWMTSAEALLRWQHPDRGLLLPSDFIPYAEEKGLIGLLGEQVLEAACTQLKAWSLIPHMAALKLAVNVSALEFCHPDFVPRMLAVIDRSGADASKLIMEFTERVMFASMEETLFKMTALKKRGISFSLDDFGIGYSSLSSLHSLPLDQLKIDRTFIRDVVTNPADAAIARSIIALGQGLNLEVLAEGVEKEDQRSFLEAHGCCAYQGYLFGRPGPAEDLLRVKIISSRNTF
ncbi:putative bifunctional diguanylate cyclase/phosphodiesterase [Granulicella arctica]|uniref:putative bifunctional diguanylate cyclase/phosphodiesterase n=1 Tax=Granulicella arctica TaxID=940613 RepID=UPI0021E070C2|nr:GGDEF and EAL domain-containing protein [Granulicella arctica]